MRAMIAVLISMFIGLLASCSGGVQTDLVDGVRQASDTTGTSPVVPVTDPDYVWYDSDADDLD